MKPFFALFALLLLPGCSFFSPPKAVRLVLPRAIFESKGRPSLAQMSHFAVLARGPVSNTLSTTDIGGRGVGCTQLEGQLFFPLSIEDISRGITVSVPPSTYRFSVVGFTGSTVSNPSSLAQVVNASPQLAEYLIAQGEINTASNSSGSLAAVYQDGVTPDLFAACPPQNYSLYFALVGNNYLTQFKSVGSGWSATTVESSNPYVAASLFVDADGVGQLLYGHGANLNLFYSNSTRTISGEPLTSSNMTISQDTAIARASNGDLMAFSNRDAGGGLAQAFLQNHTSGMWQLDTPLFPTVSNGYTQFRLEYGANGAGIAAVVSSVSPSNVQLRYQPPSGVWQAPVLISFINLQPCSQGADKPSVRLDAEGFAHVVYRCLDAANYLGYATNRSGSWVYSIVTTSVPTVLQPKLSIDGAGQMHVTYVSDGSVFYTSAPVSSAAWAMPQNVYDNTVEPTYDSELKAMASDDVNLILVQYLGPALRKIVSLTNRSGSWVASPIATTGVVALANGIYAR